MSSYIKKGDQFWNDDHTEGYEIIEDIMPMTPVLTSQFKALGNAPEPEPHHPMRKWIEDIICVPGGVDAYKERNNITKA